MNNTAIIFREARITPKKIGQFASVWKRNEFGVTQPHEVTDNFEFYIIKCRSKNRIGQFVFPKAELAKRRIVTTPQREGKRGFRVYPPWDKAENKQSIKTQDWQLNYFHYMDCEIDFQKANLLSAEL
tara:strand:- start:1439 stop:1819 length:381 start_codon:yes stop_codon:yes gene_type:complete